jgi:hypothetical protein
MKPIEGYVFNTPIHIAMHAQEINVTCEEIEQLSTMIINNITHKIGVKDGDIEELKLLMEEELERQDYMIKFQESILNEKQI